MKGINRAIELLCEQAEEYARFKVKRGDGYVRTDLYPAQSLVAELYELEEDEVQLKMLRWFRTKRRGMIGYSVAEVHMMIDSTARYRSMHETMDDEERTLYQEQFDLGELHDSWASLEEAIRLQRLR
jgi:hypothetical protein